MENQLIASLISLALSIIALGYSMAIYLWSKKKIKNIKRGKLK